MPPIAFWLRAHGHDGILKFLRGLNTDPGATWAQGNGEWVFGVDHPFDVLDAFKAYRLAPVASRIRADVLILTGAADRFVLADQASAFQRSLIHARSVKAVTFDAASGGAEHCQLGAPSLWQATLFDWLADRFPSRGNDASGYVLAMSITRLDEGASLRWPGHPSRETACRRARAHRPAC